MTGGPGVCGPGSVAPSSTADPHAKEEAAQELLVVGYVVPVVESVHSLSGIVCCIKACEGLLGKSRELLMVGWRGLVCWAGVDVMMGVADWGSGQAGAAMGSAGAQTLQWPLPT